MPVGAIFLGLFMNFYILGKEAASFDEEQRMRVSLAEKNASKLEQSKPVSGKVSLSAAVAR